MNIALQVASMVPIEHKSIHLFLQSPKVGPPLIIEYTTRLLKLGRMFLDEVANKTLQSLDIEEPFLLDIYLDQNYTLLQWRALYFSSLAFLSLNCPFVDDLRQDLIAQMRGCDDAEAYIRFIERAMVELSAGHVDWKDKSFSPNNPFYSPQYHEQKFQGYRNGNLK